MEASSMVPETPLEGPDLSIGRLISPFAESLGIPCQEFCYTDRLGIGDENMEELLKLWQLEKPNLILDIIGPANPHPVKFLNKHSIDYPSMKQIVQEARSTFSMVQSGNFGDAARTGDAKKKKKKQESDKKTTEEGKIAPASKKGTAEPTAGGQDPSKNQNAQPELEGKSDFEDQIVSVLGKRLYETTVLSIVALLKACEQTDSWITVSDGPAVTWLLLKDALQRCDARPVILIFDCHSAEEKTEKKDSEELFAMIVKASRPLESLHSMSGKGLSSLPITKVPEEHWPHKIDDAYAKEANLGLARHPCAFATHYIFSRSWYPFSLAKLAPKGTFYVNGGAGCFNMMTKALIRYEPTVFCLYSGRASNLIGSACEAIITYGATSADAVVTRMNELCPFWYQDVHIFDVADIEHVYEAIQSLLAAYKSNPRQFKDTTVVLNAMTVTPEEVLNKLSQCFGNAQCGAASLEVGAEDAKESAIAAAWDVHRRLDHNSSVFARLSNGFTFAGALLSFLTTAVSVASIAATEDGEAKGLVTYLNPLSIVLPALGGLAITVLSRFRFANKWGTMHMTKVQLESEIFKFRANIGEYDTTGFLDKHDDQKTKQDEKESQKPVTRNAGTVRRLFAKRVSFVYSQLLNGEMSAESLDLPKAVKPNQLTVPLLDKDKREESSQASRCESSELTGEAYFESRLQTEKQRLEALAPYLSRRLYRYEALILIATLVTTLLAALGYKLWIPVAVGVSSFLAVLLQYEALNGRLVAVNSAIADLASFEVEWSSMSVLERRGRTIKRVMVNLAEAAILRDAAAYAAGASSAKAWNNDSGNEGEDRTSDKKKQKKEDMK
jgi:hypothetical protein